ncbi:protein translocase subunit SecD [Hyphomonas sp. WL0036]|uniref:protein translocase subunit SecD n=1 Tax=Hyphomonas sediminis TaxID=2866160 RepID=UPI001C7F86EE|nr:protein translocase subunit SecD [Hyphomonas sediminis]MBY9068042.1 protein translocase subunit SecD [Hyphomonas sediminis]
MRTSRWVVTTYVLIIIMGLLAALPNILTDQQKAALPGWLPSKQVTLGLDLRGGSHLVLEVDAPALKADRLKALASETRTLMSTESVRGQVAVEGETVSIRITDPDGRAKILGKLREEVTQVQQAGMKGSVPDVLIQPTGDRIVLSLSEAGIADRINQAIGQSVEIVRQRVDQIGVAEPTIQRIGTDRILVQLPGLQDPTRLRELLGSTAQMSFHMVAPENYGVVPEGVTMMPDSKTGAQLPIYDKVALSGDHLSDARSGFDQKTNQPIVSFRFDAVGTKQFADITKHHVGKPFAIVLDGKVLTAPVIQGPILGGSGQITGNFTIEDTVVLSALLRAGALPAPLTVIEERTVGPDLGADVINMGLTTGLIGFGLVVGLMLLLYRGWGLIASFALFLNVALTIGILSFIGATLTLPGIAGIILGIGIAVDANILINERIREESNKGVSAMAALDRGFNAAYSTILDANVTTLIATGLLFMFGSGPVKGFAVTMIIGTLVSLFTAVAVVRILMTFWVRQRRMKKINVDPLFRFVKDGSRISFMKARYAGIAGSLILSVASIGLFMKPGLNYGIDFTGGIQVEVATPGPANLADLRSELSKLGLGEITLQEIGGKDHVLIRIQRQDGGEAAQTAAVNSVRSALHQIDPQIDVARTEVVGPKVSGELARDGVLAVIIASIAMLIYIWWRFEWNFAVGAIATLALDTTKMIGFFALTGVDFNLTAIAALLTFIGYSVNDKVVVYDRMRENIRLAKRYDLRSIIDVSINQVMGRCIFTSMTTLLAIVPMAIWGGSAVENFALPMVFGVIIATTSSIFIAAPILLFLGNLAQRHQHSGVSQIEAPTL